MQIHFDPRTSTIATRSVADRNVHVQFEGKGCGEKRERTTMANTKNSNMVICVMQHKDINY